MNEDIKMKKFKKFKLTLKSRINKNKLNKEFKN